MITTWIIGKRRLRCVWGWHKYYMWCKASNYRMCTLCFKSQRRLKGRWENM